MSPCWQLVWDGAAGGASVIAAAGGATVLGMAGGGSATSGGARGAKRSLMVRRLSRLKVETIECLQDCSEHQSKVTS
jgi:hypothetical protein